jgi:hypothetical protein
LCRPVSDLVSTPCQALNKGRGTVQRVWKDSREHQGQAQEMACMQMADIVGPSGWDAATAPVLLAPRLGGCGLSKLPFLIIILRCRAAEKEVAFHFPFLGIGVERGRGAGCNVVPRSGLRRAVKLQVPAERQVLVHIAICLHLLAVGFLFIQKSERVVAFKRLVVVDGVLVPVVLGGGLRGHEGLGAADAVEGFASLGRVFQITNTDAFVDLGHEARELAAHGAELRTVLAPAWETATRLA